MRPLRFFGLCSALATGLSLPTPLTAQQLRAEDLRTDSRIRVQQTDGETGTGLFLGIIGDTVFYEQATVLPANAGNPASLTHSIVKVPVAQIVRLDVRIQPEPSISRDKCEGVLRGAGCGAKIATGIMVDDIQHGGNARSSNDPYEGAAQAAVEAVAVGGLIVGGAVVGLIKSANRHASKNADFGWQRVHLPKAESK